MANTRLWEWLSWCVHRPLSPKGVTAPTRTPPKLTLSSRYMDAGALARPELLQCIQVGVAVLV